MKMYKTAVYENKITEIEADKYTDSSVWIKGKKVQRNTEFYSYFLNRDQAVRYLLQKEESKIAFYRKQITESENGIKRILAEEHFHSFIGDLKCSNDLKNNLIKITDWIKTQNKDIWDSIMYLEKNDPSLNDLPSYEENVLITESDFSVIINNTDVLYIINSTEESVSIRGMTHDEFLSFLVLKRVGQIMME